MRDDILDLLVVQDPRGARARSRVSASNELADAVGFVAEWV